MIRTKVNSADFLHGKSYIDELYKSFNPEVPNIDLLKDVYNIANKHDVFGERITLNYKGEELVVNAYYSSDLIIFYIKDDKNQIANFYLEFRRVQSFLGTAWRISRYLSYKNDLDFVSYIYDKLIRNYQGYKPVNGILVTNGVSENGLRASIAIMRNFKDQLLIVDSLNQSLMRLDDNNVIFNRNILQESISNNFDLLSPFGSVIDALTSLNMMSYFRKSED